MSSGLTRYRSAPSSYFTNFFNSGDGDGDGDEDGGGDCNGFLDPGPSSPGTESFFGRFMSRVGPDGSNSHNLGEIQHNSCQGEPVQSQFMASMMPETKVLHQQQQSNTYPSQMLYQSQSQSPLPNHTSAASGSSIDNSCRLGSSSMGMDCSPLMKIGGGNNSNLIRHSSSPAGLFANINVENGYGAMRGMENFGSSNCANAESTFSPARRVKGQIDFSTGPPSSSGVMNQISEIGSKSTGPDSPEDGSFSESRRNNSRYISGFPSGSWDDSAILSDNFLQRLGDDDINSFSGLNRLENQHGEGGNLSRPPTVLSHHLSLPKSSAELSSMEKLLRFQDSVPYKIRAKRGCATHPRSIAERERRSRISERMRKLQELVPNMDKQTNTADMLDLAVDYIKDLQKQVKALNDSRAKCTCSNRPNP